MLPGGKAEKSAPKQVTMWITYFKFENEKLDAKSIHIGSLAITSNRDIWYC
jgi:hypothetical protein